MQVIILIWLNLFYKMFKACNEYLDSSQKVAICTKLLSPVNIPIDGTCVRVDNFRAHSQALTIKLNKTVNLATIEQLIQTSHPWIKWVPNSRDETIQELTPLSVSGTLDIAVGRVRKMLLGESYLNIFTVGDQLLWGAAEPLRRILRQVLA